MYRNLIAENKKKRDADMAIRTDVLGGNIRYYRKVAGLTQAELSKRISITTKFLSRLELGERTPSLDGALSDRQRAACQYGRTRG